MEYGKYGEIPYYGVLEKRRDGAVRGGWSVRTFVLDKTSLHYYRRVSEQDLLGEERGQIQLKDIETVKAVGQAQVNASLVEPGTEHHYLEIATKLRTIVMRLPANEAATCESWKTAILDQLEQLRGGSDTRKDATSNSTKAARVDSIIPSDQEPAVVLISGEQPAGCAYEAKFEEMPSEWVIQAGDIGWGNTIDLGILPQGGACLLTLNDGGTARIGTQALMGSGDMNEPRWIDTTSSKIVEIQVSAEFKVTPSSTKRSEKVQEVESGAPRILTMMETASAAFLLLLLVFVNVLYTVHDFPWLHKVCLTTGVMLALASLMKSFVMGPSTSSQRDGPAATDISPDLHFTLKLHGCHVLQDGSKVRYPSH